MTVEFELSSKGAVQAATGGIEGSASTQWDSAMGLQKAQYSFINSFDPFIRMSPIAESHCVDGSDAINLQGVELSRDGSFTVNHRRWVVYSECPVK